jgi:hypothetical protein
MANEINPFKLPATQATPPPSKALHTEKAGSPSFPGLATPGVDTVNFSGGIFPASATPPVIAAAINLRDPDFNMDAYLKANPAAAQTAARVSGAFGTTEGKVKSEFPSKSKLASNSAFTDLVLTRAYSLALAEDDDA